MLYHAKERILYTNRMQMRYITFGNGAEVLVLVQGLNTRGIKGSADALAWMYRIFAKSYTVYLFDRRDNLPETCTVRDLASDLAEAMDALGLANADVFGVSQGGMIAQYLAIDRPDLVRKLVLAMTLSENNAVVQSVLEGWIAMAESRNMKQLIEDMAEKMYSEAYMKRYRLLLPLLTVLQMPKDMTRFLTLTRSCLTCNTGGELDKIHCPVLVIGGGQDKIVTGEASRVLAQKLGCELVMYESLGHAAYEEAKNFNQTVLSFFER